LKTGREKLSFVEGRKNNMAKKNAQKMFFKCTEDVF